jgi:hypothetical protein
MLYFSNWWPKLKPMAMRYRVHCPRPPLSRFVDCLWSLSDSPEHARERIVPAGTVELVVNLAEDEFRVCGSSAATDAFRRLPGAGVKSIQDAALRGT